MFVQHHPTLLDATCWPRLNTMLDDVGRCWLEFINLLKEQRMLPALVYTTTRSSADILPQFYHQLPKCKPLCFIQTRAEKSQFPDFISEYPNLAIS